MLQRPAILVVDDEPAALAAMLDALTRRFGGDYRIEPHLSAHTALDAISRCKAGGEEIALVIADQWMPDMTGNEFLGQVAHGQARAARLLGRPRGIARHPAGLRPRATRQLPLQALGACRYTFIRTSVNLLRNGHGSIAPGWS